MKIRQLFLEDNKSGNLVYLLLSLSFISIIATGIISYYRITSTVSSLKNRINEDFELSSIKRIHAEYDNIDNMLEMYLITHKRFYLEQVDTAASTARKAIADLKSSTKLTPSASELVDSLKLYVNTKARNIQQIVRFQQDASIEKLIEDYMNMQSIRSAMDRAYNDPRTLKKRRNSAKNKSNSGKDLKNSDDETLAGIEKQDLEQMAAANNINPYLEIDHNLNVKMNAVCKLLETGEIDRMDRENRQTESIIRSANASILLLGACTAVFILLAGLIYFRYLKKLAQIRKSLSESKEIAEEMTMIKERFMANMSHEIRTPLNAISGFIDQLYASEMNPKQKKQTVIIQKSIQHILNIINDILDFSKLNAGKLTLQNKGFEPAKVVRQTMELLETLIVDKSVTLKLSISEQVPAILVGDAYRLRQILLNIIGNAIKYTQVGSISIDISGSPISDKRFNFMICVKDTGIGIDEAELENIFKEFHMANNARWSKAGSSGLGLSITKMLVELFDGSIQIESQIHSGTSVCIQLPFDCGSATDLLVENSYLHDLFFLENKKIIIADDEPFNRVLLNNILHKYNAKTFEAENGQHVLSILEKESIDCILMDVKMPEMNGLQTTLKIRSLPDSQISATPIIAISAALTPENLDNFRNLDVQYAIEKPFKESELLSTVYQAMKHLTVPVKNMLPPVGETGEAGDLPFDLAELKRQAGNDPNFMNDMVDTLLSSTRKGIREIEDGMAGSDWNLINMSAHRIASPLKFIKAGDAYKCIKQIEYLTESGEDIPREIMQEQFDAFIRQFEKLESVLQTYLKNQPA